MIFYFSGTGNSKWAAKTLALETGDTLVSIPEVINSNCSFTIEKDEHVGFIFPIHGWRVPNIVKEFLTKLTIKTLGEDTSHVKHYCFCLVTAGDSIGKAMERFQQQLKSVTVNDALSLKAVCSLIMPESYVGLPGMDVDTKEKELEKKELASKQLKEFSNILKQHPHKDSNQIWGWNQLIRGPIPSFFSGPVGGFFERFLITDKPFHVDSRRCVKCGICANVCPVSDIKGGLGFEPEWLHNGKCLTCFSCYHHCPHHAIEFGKRTQKKGQYFYNKLSKRN
ncbi:EFR1 family ferrodoxin [Prevotella melaninogenica]|uniref:EFR1 family ferrodoxin n=1 Tax=Prevotella melaninogenica TaxID=28132 RepID=UPI0001AEB216|nr:EFR1 family ferrodoxin [Prevotella melaninogenica]ADK97455.1 4Fe-4S binding domain protein [Prevotella melaninogenica ATCC 25845]ASE18782.1 ferredoxin [Prevotella melaninogenica]UEB08693.1 EFR1 family ferrodoxin [Prevotella melaninogenica]